MTVRPKRELGQHFLADENILGVIGRLARLDRADVVLEIGPGLGVLTRFLADRVALVHAVELDRSLGPELERAVGARDNVRLHTLRQQWERQGQKDFRALADYVAPIDSGRTDYVGAFAVTAGVGCDQLCARFDSCHEIDNSILVKALADRLAEAFAELLHEKVRRDWGYGLTEGLSPNDLIEERYRGIRPAAGYPACPDHTEKGPLFELLGVEDATGITLTENYAMFPAAAVSGLYFAHPESRYFTVDRITREQVEDYARRKRQTIEETERWLSPNLGYDPREYQRGDAAAS